MSDYSWRTSPVVTARSRTFAQYGAQRRHYARPTATEAQNNRRLALGAQWREIIDAGLAALENQRNGGAHE